MSEGANWPREAEAASEHTNHWAWQKPKQAPLPAVKQSDWPQRPLDYFVLEKIERAGLRPADQANSHTLVRRVYLDLVGLPPSIEQVNAFVADTQPDAYERMVDRALADPGYGEALGPGCGSTWPAMPIRRAMARTRCARSGGIAIG